MKLGRNLLAALANSIWTVVVGLIAVPFYLRYLGIEAYGLIGFFVTIQALLHLLDMGMTPTINREVARCSVSGNLQEAGKLLHTLAVIYWSLACAIALLIYVIAPWIAEYWLQSNQLSPETVSHALMLMGLVVAFRWPIGLYQGALIGAQRLTVSSGINIVMVTFGSLGAVVVLAFVSPTIEAFFIWQAAVALVFSVVMRVAAWRIIGKIHQVKFDIDRLKSVWRFAAGMSGVAISGMILMQLDKVILSNILSLKSFGHYTLAAVVASGLYIFLTPLFNTIFPRMSAFVARGSTEELVDFYRTGTFIFLTIFFPIAITVAVFSEDLLNLWTGDAKIAESAAILVSLFLIGTALNGVMHFPFALQLAYGKTRLPLTINIILIVIMVPAIIFLSKSYGAVGGAAAWVFTNVIYVFLGTWLTHRYLLKGIGRKWLLGDVAVPLLMALLVVGVGSTLIKGYEYPPYINLLIGVALACITFAIMLLISKRLRKATRYIRTRGMLASILN